MRPRAAKAASLRRPPGQALGARPEPRLEEDEFIRKAREAIVRIGPELRRLERLRDRWSTRLQVGDARGAPNETGRLLTKLLEVLRHGITGLEEGWLELDQGFSKRGIVRLGRQVARGRSDR